MHRHEEDNSISEDIRNLQAIVKPRQIETAARQLGMPQFLGGDAGEAASENPTEGPQHNDAGYDVHGFDHVFCWEKSSVQHQDGELDAGDTAGEQN